MATTVRVSVGRRCQGPSSRSVAKLPRAPQDDSAKGLSECGCWDRFRRQSSEARAVERPEDWKWSSFRHYASAEIGPVEIESQWAADRWSGRAPKLLQIRMG